MWVSWFGGAFANLMTRSPADAALIVQADGSQPSGTKSSTLMPRLIQVENIDGGCVHTAFMKNVGPGRLRPREVSDPRRATASFEINEVAANPVSKERR